MRDVVRRVLVGAFVASAIAGAFVALQGNERSRNEEYVLGTAWLVTLAGLVGYVCVPGKATPAWRSIGVIGLVATVVSTMMALVAMWGDVRGDMFLQLAWSVGVVALACAWASSLSTLRAPGRSVVLWAGGLAALATTLLLAMLGIWASIASVGHGFLASFLVAAGLTAAIATQRRLGPSAPPAAGSTARFCPACGAALPATSDGRSCPSCGASFTVSFGA